MHFEGVIPVVHPTAYIHPSAVLIGDVIIGAGVYISPLASLRGDYGRLIVEAGANLQDGCVMHGYTDMDTIVQKMVILVMVLFFTVVLSVVIA